MRALMLSVVLLVSPSFAADELPANVAAYKERCEAMKAAEVTIAEKAYEKDKAELKEAKSDKDKAKRLTDLKKSLDAVKAAKAKQWNSFVPPIKASEVGSIGSFGDVVFRADDVSGDTATGSLIRPSAPARLLFRAGGQDVYSEPVKKSTAPAVVIGASGIAAGKSSRLQGLFEVISVDPLTLKPFDATAIK